MRPSVGFSPSTPVQAAGRRVEAPASVVSAIPTSPAATDTPPPQLDPPHVTSLFQGLTVRPVNGEEPIMVWANSVVVLLPMTTAPAARSRATAIVSAAAGAASCINRDPQLVGSPATLRMSFTLIGMPASLPEEASVLSFASSLRAVASALSRAMRTKALRSAWLRSQRSRVAEIASSKPPAFARPFICARVDSIVFRPG